MSNAADAFETPIAKDLIPVIVGVTGHRDLPEQHRGVLKQAVQAILAELQNKHPATPLAVLSALAEGADQLVAEVALDMGIPLFVPLPLAKDDYLQDFKTAASRSQFEELLNRAAKKFQVMGPEAKRSLPRDDPYASLSPRDEAYARAGVYVIRHSQILITLWDGKPAAPGTVGTAEMVHFRLSGIPEHFGPKRNALDPVEMGPVFHIATPRRGDEFVQTLDKERTQVAARHDYFPKNYTDPDKTRRTFAKVLGHMDRFNDDLNTGFAGMEDERKQSCDWLVPPEEQANIPKAAVSSFLRHGLADAMARRYQGIYYRTIRWLFALVILANVCGILREVFPSNAKLLAIVSFVFLAGAYVWFFLFRWSKTKDKFLDYRALAEGLRVQFFWRVVGLRDSVPEHYLRKLWTELDWIRQAIWVWIIPTRLLTTHDATPVSSERLKMALKHWVKGQQSFYRKFRTYTWIARGLQALALLFAASSLALTVWLALSAFFNQRMEDETKLLLSFLMAMSLPLAAVVTNYAQVMGYKEHAKRYEDMLELYLRAGGKLSACIDSGDTETAQTIARELGREALLENGDWLLYHRERSIELK